MIHIVDLDNTIAHDAHRIPYIEWDKSGHDRYHLYHMLAPYDDFCNRQLCADPGISIVVFTARPEMYRVPTEYWLNKHNIRWKILMMRNNDDHRHSVDIKRDMLAKLLSVGVNKAAIANAYDDREDVVAMYKEQGLKASLVKCHNQSAFAPEDRVVKGTKE